MCRLVVVIRSYDAKAAFRADILRTFADISNFHPQPQISLQTEKHNRKTLAPASVMPYNIFYSTLAVY